MPLLTICQYVNIKPSKTQISKMIQSVRSFGSWLGNLGKKVLTNIAISLGRDSVPGLVGNLSSSAINKLGREISGKGAMRASKGFILFFRMKMRMIILKL